MFTRLKKEVVEIPIGNRSPVLLGGFGANPGPLVKDAGEVGLVGKIIFGGDLANRVVRVLEVFDRVIDPAQLAELIDGNADLLFKAGPQVLGGQVNGPG